MAPRTSVGDCPDAVDAISDTPQTTKHLPVKLRLTPTGKTGESVCREASLGGRSAAAAETDAKAGPQNTCFTSTIPALEDV
jgi:hypothetical protein